MRCEDVQRAVLDEEPRSAEQDEHLRGCAECRALGRTHQAMRTLGSSSIGEAATFPEGLRAPSLRTAVMWRRRRRTTWATVAAAATAAVAAVVVASLSAGGDDERTHALRPSTVSGANAWSPPSALTRSSAPTTDAAASDEAGLAILMARVDRMLERDPVRSDETYAPFGELVVWLAPDADAAEHADSWAWELDFDEEAP